MHSGDDGAEGLLRFGSKKRGTFALASLSGVLAAEATAHAATGLRSVGEHVRVTSSRPVKFPNGRGVQPIGPLE